MPVVYVAVGRRLGYPLKLVAAYRHLFARWDQPGGERLNVEATNQGLCCHPDEYYRTGMYAAPPGFDEQWGAHRSMTPDEEIAIFLHQRGCHWNALGNHRNEAESFGWALAVAPHLFGLQGCFGLAMNEWHADLVSRTPPGFPPITWRWPTSRVLPAIPERMERDWLKLGAAESILADARVDGPFWKPMRHGIVPGRRPARLEVCFRADGCFDVGYHFN